MSAGVSAARIRLLLLDNQALFRESLSRLLAQECDFEITGQCGTAAEAIDLLALHPVDMVLLELLREDQGSQFIPLARKAGYGGKILVVAARVTAAEASTVLQLGAAGVFLKESPPDLLGKAIRAVAAGEPWVDQKVIQIMAGAVYERKNHRMRRALTDRQRQVLRGIFQGLTNKRIAAEIGVSESSVKATIQQLFEKTRVRTRGQLVRVALEESLAGARKALDPEA